MTDLNPQQKIASEALHGAVMVLAGAGSGKTRVLTQRIGNLVNSGVYPYNILAITFTNKAASEMKSRLSDVCDVRGMTICTIHSMCSRILREDADQLGYSKSFTIYDSADSKKVLKKLAKKYISESEKADKIVAEAESVLSKSKNEGISVEEYCSKEIGFSDNDDVVKKVVKGYQQQLRESDCMDFDDLLFNVYTLFDKFPQTLEKYRNRYKYISVDEFQDTNTVQYLIFKQLANLDGNIFVVGDDDQSIYGWRGAKADNMRRFKNDYKDVQVFYLEQNYRSTKKILDVANNIIKKNDDRFDKTLWTQNAEGVRVENFTAVDESHEARFCLQQISALLERGYKYGDFAILMRVNAISRAFEQECMNYGIPFKVFGGFKFFERKEIKDVVSYLRLAVNKNDNEAFIRAISTKKGIGDKTIDKLSDFASSIGKSLFESIPHIQESGIFSKTLCFKLEDFYNAIENLRQIALTQPIDQVAVQAIKISELITNITTEEEASRAENINEFYVASTEFAKDNPEATLLQFLESISLKSDIDEMDESNYLTIATIHAAKGLEWKVVFVVGMDDGIFPGNKAIFDLYQMKEERRLAYVAMTRARERLFLTHTQVRYLYGSRHQMLPSRFFSDVVGEPQRVQRYDEDGVPMYDVSPKSTTSSTVGASGSAPLYSSKVTVKKSEIGFKVGQKVMHQMYGEGIILKISNGNADIAFQSVGKKMLNLKFAPLNPLD